MAPLEFPCKRKPLFPPGDEVGIADFRTLVPFDVVDQTTGTGEIQIAPGAGKTLLDWMEL